MNAIGATALASACRLGRLECAEALIDKCDPRAKDYSGQDALMAAAESDGFECLKLALARCDPREFDRFGGSALMRASRSGNASAVELLLQKSNPRQVDSQGATALILAAASGSAQCVRLLLEASDLAAEDKLGRTAMIAALHHAQEDLAIEIASWMKWARAGRLDARAMHAAKALGRKAFLRHVDAMEVAETEWNALNGACERGLREWADGSARRL